MASTKQDYIEEANFLSRLIEVLEMEIPEHVLSTIRHYSELEDEAETAGLPALAAQYGSEVQERLRQLENEKIALLLQYAPTEYPSWTTQQIKTELKREQLYVDLIGIDRTRQRIQKDIEGDLEDLAQFPE